MVDIQLCINVYSDMNPWIDFCIIISNMDYARAYEIVKKAQYDWWGLPETTPIADYIGEKLKENQIGYEMYFKNAKDTEDCEEI